MCSNHFVHMYANGVMQVSMGVCVVQGSVIKDIRLSVYKGLVSGKDVVSGREGGGGQKVAKVCEF